MVTQEKLKDFLNSSSKVLLITGSAGTGKTTLIKTIVEYANNEDLPYYLLAPTGRAARNLNNHIGDIALVPATTIHSFLYAREDDESDDTPEIIKFAIRKEQIKNNCFIIIDEASMISNETNNEKDFLQFGSGNLFKDLIQYIQLPQSKCRLILVGDPYQLPPINVSTTQVLQPLFLEKELNISNIHHVELNQIYRQSDTSLILDIATKLRNSIKENNFLQLPIEANNQDIMNLDIDAALIKYLWDYSERSIFLSYTNIDVHNINLKFRNLNHLNHNCLEKKERLVLMKNMYINNNFYYNGDFFIVEKVGGIEKLSINMKDIDNKINIFNLLFQDVELRREGEYKTLYCKILLHKLWLQDVVTNVEELKALIIHFKKRYPNLKRGSDEYKKIIQNDPYINSLHMRFGYAMTCHKAQGGEWDNVYINLSRPNNDLKTMNGFKWAYTAITRAKNKIYLCNLPKNRQFNPKNPFEYIIGEIENTLTQYNFLLQYSKILEYELQLFITKDNTMNSFKIYRNKKMQITKLMIMQSSIHSEELANILNIFVNTSLVEN